MSSGSGAEVVKALQAEECGGYKSSLFYSRGPGQFVRVFIAEGLRGRPPAYPIEPQIGARHRRVNSSGWVSHSVANSVVIIGTS